MRLLHTQTYDFKEFIGDAVPPYVILSHRWCDSEVSYKEFRKGTKTEGAGYQKVIDACRAVRDREKVEWIWVTRPSPARSASLVSDTDWV
jgi:hypothetical protein